MTLRNAPIFISLHSYFYDFQQRECNWLSLSIFSAPVLRKNFPQLTEKGIWMSMDGKKKHKDPYRWDLKIISLAHIP